MFITLVDIFHSRYSNNQQVSETVLNIINHQKNANYMLEDKIIIKIVEQGKMRDTGGQWGLRFLIEWSSKASMRRWRLGKDLKEAMGNSVKI